MSKMNPVYIRGIKSRMRGMRAPILMSVYLAIVLGIFALVYLPMQGVTNGSRPAAVGSDISGTLFVALALIIFAVIVLMVPAMNAGVIAAEREKQTLDLLLCTQLSARKIVMGKLLSNLTFVAFLLVLTLPLFAIIYLFGGLQIQHLLKLLLYLLICALACGAISTFFSCLLKKTSVATVLSYVVLLLYELLTLFIGLMMYTRHMEKTFYQDASYVPFLWKINPIIALVDLCGQAMPTSGYFNTSYFYYGGGLFSVLRDSMNTLSQSGTYLYSSLMMIGVSVVLIIFGAVLIKPVKKLQIGK